MFDIRASLLCTLRRGTGSRHTHQGPYLGEKAPQRRSPSGCSATDRVSLLAGEEVKLLWVFAAESWTSRHGCLKRPSSVAIP